MRDSQDKIRVFLREAKETKIYPKMNRLTAYCLLFMDHIRETKEAHHELKKTTKKENKPK